MSPQSMRCGESKSSIERIEAVDEDTLAYD
jgi:hypothetical protein